MKYVIINVIYIFIKSSILSLLIHIFAKDFYQKYGRGGANYFTPPPPSMTYYNVYERYLLPGDIQNKIIKLYKTELLNIVLKDINVNILIQFDGIEDILEGDQVILEVSYLTKK